MQYVSRSSETTLTSLLSQDVSTTGAILIEGARQVGKTTLAQHVIKLSGRQITAIDLEDNTLLRQRIDQCTNFQDFEDLIADDLNYRPGNNNILFIDEAQESLCLGRFVRYMKERWSETQVILTGSSLTRLFRGETRYPVGRVTRFHVAPFDFREYLTATDQHDLATALNSDLSTISQSRHRRYLELYDSYLATGGMPEVVRAHAEGKNTTDRKAELLADLHNDFLRLFGEEDIDTVQSCLRSVANFVGSPSKISTVIKSTNRKQRKTAESVFARLEQWAIILRADQRGPSPESAHSYLPKRYLFDTGLLRQLRESAVPSIHLLDTLDVSQRGPLGGILENQIAIDIHHLTGSLQGWKRSSSGSEIDFVVEAGTRRYPVECKAALNIKLTHLKGMRAYMDRYGLAQGVTVSLAPYSEIHVDDRKVLNIPAYFFRVWLKLMV
jgi:uncharacterized protein